MNPENETELPVSMMTESEARSHVERINHHVGQIRALILDLYEREGWRALGYASWRECVVAEFEQSQSRLYQLLETARVEKNISNILEIGETLPAKPIAGEITDAELLKIEQAGMDSISRGVLIMAPDHPKWAEFCSELKRLTSNKCSNNHDNCRALLPLFDADVEQSIDFFKLHGGFCDREVLMNL